MITEKIKPAFENETNCIVFSSDEAYIPLTTVAIQSIIDNRSKDHNYDIIILHDGVKEYLRKIVEDMAVYENISIRFYDVRNIFNNIKNILF